MINIKDAKKFCKDYTKIENYEEAMNDTTQVWHCHQILGEILTKQQLLDHDFYYNIPPCMLKFITETEHKSLHNKGEKNPMYGKHQRHSEATRRKMSESHKGKPSHKKGVTLSDETRKKISESMKGRTFSDETRKKLSEALKGKKHKPFTEETRKKMSESAKRRHAATKKI